MANIKKFSEWILLNSELKMPMPKNPYTVKPFEFKMTMPLQLTNSYFIQGLVGSFVGISKLPSMETMQPFSKLTEVITNPTAILKDLKAICAASQATELHMPHTLKNTHNYLLRLVIY